MQEHCRTAAGASECPRGCRKPQDRNVPRLDDESPPRRTMWSFGSADEAIRGDMGELVAKHDLEEVAVLTKMGRKSDAARLEIGSRPALCQPIGVGDGHPVAYCRDCPELSESSSHPDDDLIARALSGPISVGNPVHEGYAPRGAERNRPSPTIPLTSIPQYLRNPASSSARLPAPVPSAIASR